MSNRPKAYLCYSEADEAKVARLRARLLDYVVPAALRAGGPARLGRFIPDAASVRGGDKAQQMAGVEWLIVLASPNSFASQRVNADVDTYLVSNPVGRFLLVVLDGEPMQVLPPRLRARQPVTADLRPEADGAELGFLKLVGALTDLNVGALRDHQAKSHRLGAAAGLVVTAAFALAGAAGGVAAVSFMRERDQAAAMAGQAIEVGTDIAAGAGEADVEALARAERQFEDLFAGGLQGPAFTRQRTRVLVQFAELYQARGDDERARARALAAIEVMDALSESERNSPDLVRALALVSRAESEAGRSDEALAYASRAVTAARAVANGDDGARASLAGTLGWLGELHLRAGRQGEALPLFAEAAPILAALQADAPADPGASANLVTAIEHLGDAQTATGDHAGAAASYGRLTALLRAQTQEAKNPAALGAVLAKLSQALVATGDHAGARAPADESLALARQLSAASPDDDALRRELSARVILAARVRAALGRASGELMEEALAAARAQAQARPADIGEQLTLAELLAAQGARLETARSFEDARQAWREAAQVRRRLLAMAPSDRAHAVALADISEQIAAVSARLADRSGELSAYAEAIRMRRTLVTASSGDKPSRAALARTLHAAALARVRADNKSGAAAAFDEAARLRTTLAEEDLSDRAMAELALESLRQLAPLQTEANATTAARRTLTAIRDISSRLAEANPGETRYAASLRRAEAALRALDEPATQ